jgi:hypothetical protein
MVSKNEPMDGEAGASGLSSFNVLLEALLRQNENYAEQMGRLNEALVQGLAERNTGLRDVEIQLIRDYEVIRRQLAGPSDDEATTLPSARIVSVNPPAAMVGDEIAIHLRNAGNPTRVAFAAENGTLVEVTPAASASGAAGLAGRGARDRAVRVTVPDGAVTGRITVITDRGDPTSAFDFYVLASAYPDLASPGQLFVRFRQEGQR